MHTTKTTKTHKQNLKTQKRRSNKIFAPQKVPFLSFFILKNARQSEDSRARARARARDRRVRAQKKTKDFSQKNGKKNVFLFKQIP